MFNIAGRPQGITVLCVDWVWRNFVNSNNSFNTSVLLPPLSVPLTVTLDLPTCFVIVFHVVTFLGLFHYITFMTLHDACCQHFFSLFLTESNPFVHWRKIPLVNGFIAYFPVT